MKKILCIVDLMNTGGAQTFLMKIFRAMDRTRYVLDFITIVSAKGFYDAEIRALGGSIYHMFNLKLRIGQSLWRLYQTVKINHYEAVLLSTHCSAYALLLVVAKLAGAKVVALRCTNTCLPKRNRLLRFLHRAFAFLPNMVTDVKLAPSQMAARYMFHDSDDVHKLHNGIPIATYTFDWRKRDKIRQELNIGEDTLLIGHVGRLESQKNHAFLINVFREIRNRRRAKFILVGEGSEKDKIARRLQDLGLEGDVKFLGVRADVPDLLMGMDGMVFPSLYEGMPNVIIEAQATGLPCLVSDSVTEECAITDRVRFMSLSESVAQWAETIQKMLDGTKDRKGYGKIVKKMGYDIESVQKEFVKLLCGTAS